MNDIVKLAPGKSDYEKALTKQNRWFCIGLGGNLNEV